MGSLRVAVAASSSLDVVPQGLLEFLGDGTPDPTVVLLRRGVQSSPGRFESLIAEWCRQFAHLEHRWCFPDPKDGRAQVFNRDAEMVRASDLVLAFFVDQLEGGTAHVVERAIDLGVPVYSFSLGDEPSGVIRLGEHDPTDSWGAVVDGWFG
jgi:hypothetical protein